MQNQTATACPLPTLQRNLDIIAAARIGRKFASFKSNWQVIPPLARRLPTVAAPALPQVDKTEGRGTYFDLTPEKVQRLVRTCGAYPIAKMLAKRGVPCRVARQLMGV